MSIKEIDKNNLHKYKIITVQPKLILINNKIRYTIDHYFFFKMGYHLCATV